MEKTIAVKNTYNISDELFHEIRSRVYLLEKDIVFVDEIKNITPETINVEFDRLEELVEDQPYFAHLINLEVCKRPDAKTREVINRRFMKLSSKTYHVAFATGSNILIRTAIRFVIYASGLKSISVSKSVEEAKEKCKNARPRQST